MKHPNKNPFVDTHPAPASHLAGEPASRGFSTKEPIMKISLFALASAIALTACTVTPQTESTPVNLVEIHNGKLVRVTERGPNTIVCADYWQNFTLWDSAVLWPDGMRAEDATAICRSKQQMALEAPTARPWEPVFNHRRNSHDAMLTDAANGAVGRRDVLAR